MILEGLRNFGGGVDIQTPPRYATDCKYVGLSDFGEIMIVDKRHVEGIGRGLI